MGYFLDPAQQFFMELEAAQADQSQRYFDAMAADPALMNRLIGHSLANPTASAELNLALAQGGVPAGDPLAQFAVEQELANRQTNGPIEQGGGGWWNGVSGVLNEYVVNPIQGATRWTFSAWDAAYNMVAGGAPIRALQQSRNEGVSFGEAWRDQDPYFFEALGGLFAGERVNLGSGFFAGSELADGVSQEVNRQMMELEQSTEGLPTSERYSTRLQAAPDIWRSSIEQFSTEQAELGRPLTQLHDADVQSVMFNVGGAETPWSPGRIAAATITEPGTEPFKWVSGTLDFSSQIFLDPVEWLGIGWARSGVKARQMWAEGQKAADEVLQWSDQASAAERAGRVLGTGEEIPAGARALGTGEMPPMRVVLPETDPTRAYMQGMIAVEPEAMANNLLPVPTGRNYSRIPGQTAEGPWWLGGATRPLAPTDAPRWYVDHVNAVFDEAIDVADTTPVMKVPGVYDIELPRVPGQRRNRIRIQRRNKGKKDQYWEAVMPDGTRLSALPDDPRFSTANPRFRTLKEAQDAAVRQLEGNFRETSRYNGMTMEEFMDTAEDFAIEDAREVMNRTSERAGTPVLHRVRKSTSETTGPLDRAQARVFGRTVDLSAGTTDDLPQGLVDALRADRKLRGNQIVGFGDPNLDKFQNTMRWMEENGYGKLRWDDDTVLFHDRFIGGDPENLDPMSRVWFPSKDTPIYRERPGSGLEDMEPPTAGDVQDFVDFVSTNGGRTDAVMTSEDALTAQRNVEDLVSRTQGIQPDGQYAMNMGLTKPREETVEYARRLKDADGGNVSPLLTDGPRRDVDPTFQLHGKKVDQFIDKLFSATREGGGQTDTRLIDNLLRFYRRQGVKVPNQVRTDLLEAGSKAEVREIIARMMVEEGTPRVTLPGGTQYGRLSAITGTREPRVGWREQHWFARRVAEGVSHREVNMVEDPDGFYELVDDALAHYNLSRGAEVQRYDLDTGEQIAGTIKVEDIMDRIRGLNPGDRREAFDIMGDLNEALFAGLVDEGVDPRLARFVSRWFKDNGDKAIFDAERMGRIDKPNGPSQVGVLEGATIGGGNIQVTADMWGGSLSLVDQRSLRRAGAESDIIGRAANRITSKRKVVQEGTEARIAGELLEDRAWNRWATNTMQNVWKPFVLLRGAWTLRILIDDQARMAADGYSMFNHPARVFGYAMMHPSEWRDAFMRGYVDVNGVRMTTDNIDNLAHGRFLQDAMMKGRDPMTGRGGAGSLSVEAVSPGNPKYAEGIVFEMQRLHGSTTTKVLAYDQSDQPVKRTVDWLMGRMEGSGAPDPSVELANLAGLYDDLPDVQKAIMAMDEPTLTRVVERQWAILNHRLGGDVKFIDADGRVMDFARRTVVDQVEPPAGGPRFEVRGRGDQDLMDIVGGRNDDLFKANPETGRADELDALVSRKIKESEGTERQWPNSVRRPKGTLADDQSDSNVLDEVIRTGFDFLMTKPSNYLSRVPEFRRAYWERMSEFAPYMDEALRDEVSKLIPASARQTWDRALRDSPISIDGQNITNLDQLDQTAKAYALTRVEQTLFDLTNKRNISDALTLIFPFVEAWGEFIGRWGRLMVAGDRNIANARRLQQGVEGARGSGFFYEDENGNEVFNYPSFLTKAGVAAHNTLNNVPGLSSVLGADVSPEVADAIQSTGSVESLNFASGVIPGFGPVFQLAAKQLLPDDPRFDTIKNVIAPFGLSGGIANQFAPAWVKRLLSANQWVSDPALQYTYNSTLMDVMRTKIDRGDFAGVTSVEDVNRIVEEVEREAQGVLMVRAVATFWNPASPSYRFQKEDANGYVWSYSNLGEEYRSIQQSAASEDEAWATFYERYGLLPTAFTGGKTYPVVNRALGEAGWRFERGNPDLFRKYPETAMYLDPNIALDSEYSHEAMLAQLQRGLREQWTPEQFIYLKQDQLGDMWWDNANRVAAAMPSQGRQPYLAGVREQIEARFPFWNKQVPGRVQGSRPAEKIAEVEQWVTDPDLAGEPVVNATRIYLAYRQQVLDQLAPHGASSIDGPKSTTTIAGRIATGGRQWLREQAELLRAQYPEFGPLFDSIFRREVGAFNDAPAPAAINIDNDGDYFFDLGVAG